MITNSRSIVSFVCGLVALFVPIPFVLGIIAIVQGNKAKNEISVDPGQTGESFAQAGIILGWVDIGLSFFMILSLFIFFSLFAM